MPEIPYEQLTSGELVELWKRGDRTAGEELVRRFMEALRRDLHAEKGRARRFDRPTTAVVDSVWYRFFKQLQNGRFVYQGSLALRNWLVKVGKRIIGRPRPKRPEGLPNGPDPPDLHPAAPQLAEQDDYVSEFLRRLKPDTRRMVQLILEGGTIEQVSVKIGRSRHWIMRKLRRLRNMPCLQQGTHVRD
jgi:hypothetical protein